MEISAYSKIPPGKPESLEELADLYGPVINYWVSRCHPSVMRGYEDFRQDAWMKLVEAFYNYDPERGTQFKTYAVMMVRWAVKDRINYGMSLHSAVSNKNYDRLNFLTGMTYLDDLRYRTEKKYNTEGNESWAFVDKNSEEPFNLSESSFETLCDMVENPRLRYIVEQYYGQDRTLDDIGQEIDVSGEYVRQLLQKVYGVIRQRIYKKKSMKVKPIFKKEPTKSISTGQTCKSSIVRPLKMSDKISPLRLAEIVDVSKRTIYRWIKQYGKGKVIEMCQNILDEFEQLIKPNDLATKFGLSRNSIYRLVAEKKIKGYELFGSIRIPLSEVRRIYKEAEDHAISSPRSLTDKELSAIAEGINK